MMRGTKSIAEVTDICECSERVLRFGALAFALSLSAACAVEEAPDQGPVGEVVRPNYEIRLDTESSDPTEYHLVEDDDGIRVQTGPAGIAYRSDDQILSGGFRLGATFAQYDAPVGYREAFGVFVGGRDLQSPDLEYTYLLVRTTGDFLIKRRIGEITETIVDWTPHEAVVAVAADGDRPVNRLEVDVTVQSTRFLVNGVTVHELETARVRPYGVSGVRVNHRLDVRVDNWSLLADS